MQKVLGFLFDVDFINFVFMHDQPYPTLQEIALEHDARFNASCEATSHVIADRHETYDDTVERIQFTRVKDYNDVYIQTGTYHEFDRKTIGKINENEIPELVKFLENYKPKTNPQTLDEELLMLRRMAGVMIELMEGLDNKDGTWKHSKYCHGHPISVAVRMLAKDYKNRFGRP